MIIWQNYYVGFIEWTPQSQIFDLYQNRNAHLWVVMLIILLNIYKLNGLKFGNNDVRDCLTIIKLSYSIELL